MELYEKYVGLVFDNRYRIEKVIGVGGMAIVFKATDLLMRRVVAVKILKDEISADEQSVKRFINESKAVAMLSHPNIVNIYDVSVRENVKYIVMEFVEGITLKNHMKHREVLGLREIISYTTQILRALDHAHKKGIVHRDIKPQNIMLVKNGIMKVTDFGIAKLPNTETITMTDKAIGTVYYISPEQVTGKDNDNRSDLYSLGVMMYEMATGTLPFTADTPLSVAMKQVNDEPTPPREINPYIPVGLEHIILKAMEKDPEQRYQSAEEMLGQLQKLRDNPKIIFKEKKPKSAKQNKDVGERVPKKTSKSMFPIILGVTVAFLIAAGISVGYMYNKLFVNSSINSYHDISVENFVGATYTVELDEWFKASDYYAAPTLEYKYDDSVQKGVIIDQEPKSGEKRRVLKGKQKCEVTLIISGGQKTSVLNDYTAKDYRTVMTELRKMGLAAEKVEVESAIYDNGYVVRTDPAAGTTVTEDTKIVLYVSKGVTVGKTTVPSFIGMNEGEALAEVIRCSLSVGKVTYKRSETSAGVVLEQGIKSHTEVDMNTPVSFVVSGGPNYDETDNTIPPTITDSDINIPPIVDGDDENGDGDDDNYDNEGNDNTDNNDNDNNDNNDDVTPPDNSGNSDDPSDPSSSGNDGNGESNGVIGAEDFFGYGGNP